MNRMATIETLQSAFRGRTTARPEVSGTPSRPQQTSAQIQPADKKPSYGPLARTGLNVGSAELACSGFTSAVTRAGLVMNQSTPAIAMNVAAPIAASPFMVIFGIQACASC